MSRAVHNSCHSKKGEIFYYVWLGVGLECSKATPIEHTNLRTFTILSQYLKIGLVIQRLVVIANTKLNYICIAKLGKTSPYICNLSILRTFLGYIFCLLLFYIFTTYLYNSQLQSVVRQSPYLCSPVNRLVLTKEIIQCSSPAMQDTEQIRIIKKENILPTVSLDSKRFKYFTGDSRCFVVCTKNIFSMKNISKSVLEDFLKFHCLNFFSRFEK